jgi:general secretion pathway protein G
MIKVNSKKLTVNSLAFTLIELLVVISIIGILAVLVAANLNSARSRARDAERKSDLKNIQTALRLFYNDNGTYPRSNSGDNKIIGCGNTINTLFACTWGIDSLHVGSAVYMTTLPSDPSCGTDQNCSLPNYQYIQNVSGSDSYELDACLENGSDPNGIPSTIGCSSGVMFQLTQ